MPSPSSCVRCARPLAVESDGGLCPVCLAADDTSRSARTPGPAAPAPDTASLRPAVEPAGSTVTRDPPAWPATPRPGTATDPEPGLADRLPEAPTGYELLRRLDGGGMGEVFLARDVTADHLVAIKFLRAPGHPDLVERFLREVRALARVDHPNIVRVFAHDFYRAAPYFTMEYAAGGTLSDRIKRAGPLDPAEAARVMAPVARAVHAAHAAGVIHRDLKPSNVLLAADGAPKVADFGLARRTDEDDGLTTMSGALGTPGYMPPEQISRRRFGEAGPAADVYGLGATLYHLLTGRPPFVAADSREQLAARIPTEPPVRVRALRPEVPLGLEAIVLKCLEKQPADRYPSAAAVADELEKFLAGRTPDAPPLTRWRRARRWAHRQRVRLAAAAAVVASAAGLALTLTPADPLKDLQRQLRSGKPVTLVGPTGLPGWHDWRLGPTALKEELEAERACAFQSLDSALLELCPDPTTDRFALAGEIKVLVSRRITDAAGLYVGYTGPPAGNGMPAHLFVALRYNDYPPPPDVLKVRKRDDIQLNAVVIVRKPDGGISDPHTAGVGRSLPVDFARGGQAGNWQQFRAEVTPDGVTWSWPSGPAPGQPVRVTAREIEAAFSNPDPLVASDPIRQANRMPNVRLAAPSWNPRGGIGVWTTGAQVAVRNVVFEPLPPP